MIEAAQRASDAGTSLDRALTVNVDALIALGLDGLWCKAHPADAMHTFLDLLRRWLKARGVPWAAVWVRERARREGEHGHVAFHASPMHDAALLAQLGIWTGAPATTRRSGDPQGTLGGGDGDGARKRPWLLQANTGGPTQTQLMAYFGKGEPDALTRWGAMRENARKRFQDGRCAFSAATAGRIEGTVKRAMRWGMSQSLMPRRAKVFTLPSTAAIAPATASAAVA